MCGSHVLTPSLVPTEMRIISSLSRKPIAVIGGTFSQSPAWSAQAEGCVLDLLACPPLLKELPEKLMQRLPPTLSIWIEAVPVAHLFETVLSKMETLQFYRHLPDIEWMQVKIAFWSWSVNAAEAKKADSASISAFLIPNPPILT